MKYPLMFVAAATMLAPCAGATDFSHEFKVERHAVQQVRDGRDIFRYATFGDEAFWGDGIGLHLALAGKAYAFLQGRDYVTPQDVKSIGMDILRHRVLTTYEAEADGVAAEDLIQRVLDAVAVP